MMKDLLTRIHQIAYDLEKSQMQAKYKHQSRTNPNHEQSEHGNWAQGMGGTRDGVFPSRGGGSALLGGISSGAQEMDLASRIQNVISKRNRRVTNSPADAQKRRERFANARRTSPGTPDSFALLRNRSGLQSSELVGKMYRFAMRNIKSLTQKGRKESEYAKQAIVQLYNQGTKSSNHAGGPILIFKKYFPDFSKNDSWYKDDNFDINSIASQIANEDERDDFLYGFEVAKQFRKHVDVMNGVSQKIAQNIKTASEAYHRRLEFHDDYIQKEFNRVINRTLEIKKIASSEISQDTSAPNHQEFMEAKNNLAKAHKLNNEIRSQKKQLIDEAVAIFHSNEVLNAKYRFIRADTLEKNLATILDGFDDEQKNYNDFIELQEIINTYNELTEQGRQSAIDVQNITKNIDGMVLNYTKTTSSLADEYNRLQAERSQLQSEQKEFIEQLQVDFYYDIFDAMAAENPLTTVFTNEQNLIASSPRHPETIKKALSIFPTPKNMTGDEQSLDVDFSTPTSSRAGVRDYLTIKFDRATNKETNFALMQIEPNMSTSVMVHETMHLAQQIFGSGFYAPLLSWIENRIDGSLLQPLQQLSPAGNYEKDEFAFDGKVDDPYTLKAYYDNFFEEFKKRPFTKGVDTIDQNSVGSFSEVQAMGMSYLYNEYKGKNTQSDEVRNDYELTMQTIRSFLAAVDRQNQFTLGTLWAELGY
jgi:hypothetical protein